MVRVCTNPGADAEAAPEDVGSLSNIAPSKGLLRPALPRVRAHSCCAPRLLPIEAAVRNIAERRNVCATAAGTFQETLVETDERAVQSVS